MGIIRRIFAVPAVFFCIAASAQENIIERSANMLPPSPTASELGKYGLLPVSLATGTVSANIPLYTFKTRNLAIPISLSYSSNGIKVDQLASWVGMGWSLNSGGVVTKVIRDEPDDANPEPYPAQFGLDNSEAIEYLEKADPINGFDSEQDLYTFNFLGHTGKFMYSRDGELVIMPHQNISIQQLVGASPSSGYFKITTDDGVIYTFDAIESVKTVNEGTGCGRALSGRRESSWYLTKIEHPSGDMITLEYEEYQYQYPLSVSQTVGRNLATQDFGCNPTNPTPCVNDYIQTCATHSNMIGKYLKKIGAVGYGSIEFAATDDRLDVAGDYKLNEATIKDVHGNVSKRFVFNYVFSQSDVDFSNQWTTLGVDRRMFLTSVEQRDGSNAFVNSHILTYEDMNGLPPRLSYAQDHWGYFNGADNEYLVPVDEQRREDAYGRKVFEGIGGNRNANSAFAGKGLLKTITWPTGGQTSMEYEPNAYYGPRYVYPSDSTINMYVTGTGLHTLRSETTGFSINYTQEIKIETRCILENQDYPGDEIDPLHHIVTVSVTDLTTSTVVYSEHLALGQSAVKYLDVDTGHTYEIELTASGRIVYGTLTTGYIPGPPESVNMNIETGGMRIARTVDTDPVTGAGVTTNYLYSALASPQISSGVSRALPVYYATDTQITEITCPTENGGAQVKIFCYNGIMHSTSISTLYPTDGGNVFYRYVTVTTGSGENNGATQHEFIINFDQPGQQIWGNDEILSTPLSNFGWNNGLEKEVRVLKRTEGDYVLLKSVLNEYTADERIEKEIRNLVVRRRYEPVYNQNAVITITCDAASISARWEQMVCTTQHSHAWLIAGNVHCIADNNHNVTREFFSVCHGHTPGETVILPYALDHIDAMEYRNIAYWFYLSKTTETNYDDNGLNPVVNITEYLYDNPRHALLSKTRYTTSDGQIKEVSTKYVDDYNEIPELETLRSKFIVGIPIETLSTIDNKLVQADIITYSEQGLPVELYKYEGTPLVNYTGHDPSVIVPSTDYRSQAVLSYDTLGNLRDMVSRKMPDISYVWGYSGTKVVAKAVGSGSARIFVEGFETTGTGTAAKTGEKCLASGSYTISVADFNPASTSDLVLSYWYWDADKWKFSGELPFSRNIVSAGSKLDEIRVYPKGAQLTTMTYDTHFDAVKSVTDPNNVTQYYSYDSAGRLQAVRDENGNITTTYKYHFYNN